MNSRIANLAIWVWVRWLYLRLGIRLWNYRRNQSALARRYGLDGAAPESYGEATRERIIALAESSPEQKQFAWTSGTTREPKQIYYPAHRAKRVQRTLMEQVMLAYDSAGVQRPSFYLLTSMTPDKSWSSMFVRRAFPAVAQRLLLSGSILFSPEAAKLVGRYSQTSVHIALWLMSEPTFIVTANPSSLYVVLEQAQADWGRIREEVKQVLAEEGIQGLWANIPAPHPPRQARIESLLSRSAPPSAQELLPQFQVLYCWDGGYVQPFIDNLKRQLAGKPVQFLPMFSVSTETVAYQVYPQISTRGGLPIYPGNCYEFVPIEQEMRTENILKPWELETGQEYVMIVSDAFGLVRYNTEDVFECRGMVEQTPLLYFKRRVGLRFSFTGEKITAEQLVELYESIRLDFELEGAIFSCFPTLNAGELPGYVFVHCTADEGELPFGLDAAEFDERLMEINLEYATKRKSGRLAAPRLVPVQYGRLVEAIRSSNPRFDGSNPAQFKMLPLYKVMWQDLSHGEEQIMQEAAQ
jgi:hypothetical protein